MYSERTFKVIRSIANVLSRPAYALTALVSSFAVLEILVWLFTFDTLWYVLTMPDYPVSEKLSYFLSPFVNSFTYFFQDPVAASRLIFSVLAGLNLALYVYIRQHQQPVSSRKGLGGLATALVASGCVACGTSIFSPLLVGVGVGASAIIGAMVSTVGYLIGIILMLYSINGFGKRVAYELATR